MQTLETPKLVCRECRRENEAQRIYCHDCGTRLDRASLAKVVPKAEDPKEVKRRVESMFDPRRGKLKRDFFKLSKLVLGAGLVALLVQVFRPPDVPPLVKPAPGEMPPQISLDLENATRSANAAPLQYSEDQVNAYLANTLKSKQTTLSKYLKFERLVLGFDEGAVRVTTQRSQYGYSVYTTGVYSVELKDGKLIFKDLGGQIGRLRLHPQLMHYADLIFSDVASALERDRKLLAKLGAIEFHPKQIVFVPKPPQT